MQLIKTTWEKLYVLSGFIKTFISDKTKEVELNRSVTGGVHYKSESNRSR